MRSKIFKILNVLFSVLCILVIIFSIFVICVSVLTPKDSYPKIFGYSLFKVQTESMEPEIMTGDVIFVKLKAENEEYKKGDIITFFSPDAKYEGMIVTHRVYIVTEDGYLTWGDNREVCPYRDEFPVTGKSIIGKTVKVSSFLGKITDVLQNKLLFALIVIAPLAYIALRILISVGIQFKRELENSEDEGENEEEKSKKNDEKEEKRT